MRRVARRGFVLATVGAALALSVGLFSRVFGRRRLRFPYLTGAIDAGVYEDLAAREGWTPLRIEVAEGIFLNGLVSRPHAPSAPWLVYYPGNDRTMLARGQAVLERIRANTDFGLAVFAYRGYDSSDGVARLDELAHDAPRILELLSAHESVPFAAMHVVGFSIGGHLAVRAVGGLARAGKRTASLTLLASVDDIVMVPQTFYERIDPGDDFQTRPYLDAIPAPVLVIQGTDDEALQGADQGRAISRALGDRARYVELSGVGHEALLEDARAIAEVQAFVSEHRATAEAQKK